MQLPDFISRLFVLIMAKRESVKQTRSTKCRVCTSNSAESADPWLDGDSKHQILMPAPGSVTQRFQQPWSRKVLQPFSQDYHWAEAVGAASSLHSSARAAICEVSIQQTHLDWVTLPWCAPFAAAGLGYTALVCAVRRCAATQPTRLAPASATGLANWPSAGYVSWQPGWLPSSSRRLASGFD